MKHSVRIGGMISFLFICLGSEIEHERMAHMRITDAIVNTGSMLCEMCRAEKMPVQLFPAMFTFLKSTRQTKVPD